MSSTIVARRLSIERTALSLVNLVTENRKHEHVTKNLDKRLVSANDFVNSSPSTLTDLKVANKSRQTTALSTAEWEAALLPGDLE